MLKRQPTTGMLSSSTCRYLSLSPSHSVSLSISLSVSLSIALLFSLSRSLPLCLPSLFHSFCLSSVSSLSLPDVYCLSLFLFLHPSGLTNPSVAVGVFPLLQLQQQLQQLQRRLADSGVSTASRLAGLKQQIRETENQQRMEEQFTKEKNHKVRPPPAAPCCCCRTTTQQQTAAASKGCSTLGFRV